MRHYNHPHFSFPFLYQPHISLSLPRCVCMSSLIPYFIFTSHKLWVLIAFKDESYIDKPNMCVRGNKHSFNAFGRSFATQKSFFVFFVWRSNEYLFESEFIVYPNVWTFPNIVKRARNVNMNSSLIYSKLSVNGINKRTIAWMRPYFMNNYDRIL